MGILNVTPDMGCLSSLVLALAHAHDSESCFTALVKDSFSDGGDHFEVQKAAMDQAPDGLGDVVIDSC